MKLVVIFITGYSGHSVDEVPLGWRVDPAFELSPRDLLDNLFVSWVSYEIGRDFYYRLQWSVHWWSPSLMTSWPPAFEPSPHDLLDNLFISWVSNEIGRDFITSVSGHSVDEFIC